MEPSGEERCICQICTCGRHRCRKHPQQSTLEFGPGIASRTRESVELQSSSLAHKDFTLSQPVGRPVIKKLVDNLHVSPGQLEANSSLRTDYPEFQVSRPVIHRLTDQLQISPAEFSTKSVSQDQYKEFSVKRPEGGRKLQSSLKVGGELDAVSTNHSQYQDHENYVRPTVNRIPDKFKLEGGDSVPLEDLSVSNRDYRQFSVQRPVIQRLHSSLKIAPGSMEQTHSLAHDTYKEIPVSRPKRHLLPDSMAKPSGDMAKTSYQHDDYRRFSVERPVIKKLQDNLAVSTSAKFADQPRSDYAEHPSYSKPIRKRMEDTLKLGGDMGEQSSQSHKDYIEFHAERPTIKKLQDSIPIHPKNGGYAEGFQHQTTNRDYQPLEARRPVVKKLDDHLKMEGEVEARTFYKEAYGQQQEAIRPEVKRMHSTLAISTGDFAKSSVVKADYPEHHVARPIIMKLTNQLQTNDASWGAPDGATRPAAGMRRFSQPQESFSVLGQPLGGRSMTRGRQMESSIQLGSLTNGQTMTSTAQETYTTLEGAQRSRMTRPRTSNRLQEWNSVDQPSRSRTVQANRMAQPSSTDAITRDQGMTARKKHQMMESTLKLNGHEDVPDVNSLYKKSFTLPAIEPCPASLLHANEKSSYQFTREIHNHRFYKPVNSKA